MNSTFIQLQILGSKKDNNISATLPTDKKYLNQQTKEKAQEWRSLLLKFIHLKAIFFDKKQTEWKLLSSISFALAHIGNLANNL